MNELQGSSFPALLERRTGTLEVGRSALRFALDDASVSMEIPLSRVRISVGGLNTPLIYVADAASPNAVLTVQSLGALEALAAVGAPGADQARSKMQRRHRRQRNLLVASIGGIAFLLFGLPLAVWVAPAPWLGALVSMEQERGAFGFLGGKVGDRCTTAANSSLEGRVFSLMEHLKSASAELRALPAIQVCLNETGTVNAFALPGATIVVNTGLLDAARSVDEIAGVVAHELGHLEQRHPLKAVLKALGAGAGVAAVSLAFGGDIGLWVGRGANLFTLGYSRSDELTADERAVAFLRSAGLSPEGMVSFFDRLQASEVGGSAGAVFQIASTHPPSDERAAKIREASARYPARGEPPLVTLEQLRSSTQK